MPVTWLRLSKKARGRLGRDCSSAPESVELLGKEHSSDQCHMMQEVCQHFSSSSLARRRGRGGLHALAPSQKQIMETSHEPGDAPQALFYVGEFVCASRQQCPSGIILFQLVMNLWKSWRFLSFWNYTEQPLICASHFYQVTCPAVASWTTTRLSPALETPPGELWYCA